MTGDDTSADAVEPLDGEAEELRRGAEASAEDVSSDEAKQRFGEAVAVAARRSGIARAVSSGSITGHDLLGAMGGVRGLAEAILPGLAFLVLFTITRDLLLSLGVSVAVAVVFTAVRLVTRSSPVQAIAGLIGVVASAALALVTGRGEDNFLLGILTNAAYAAAMLVSLVVRWPLLGVAVGYLMGDGTAWRRHPVRRRALSWLTVGWLGLFVARLAVELPLYLATDFAHNIEWLAAAKLLMGVPLYVPLLIVTWLVARSVYRVPTSPVDVADSDAAGEQGAPRRGA